jgi:photosystem II stability/assembly factor-like uncharacterized protein
LGAVAVAETNGGKRTGISCIRVTTDGGKTWNNKYQLQTGEENGRFFVDVRLASEDMIIAVDYRSTYYISTNKGDNWEIHETPLGIKHITDMDFFDENYGVVCYFDEQYLGLVYVTTDGGRSWEFKKPGPDKYYHIKMVDITSESVLYALIRKYSPGSKKWKLYRSENLGETWDSVFCFEKEFFLSYYMDFVDENHGWLAYSYDIEYNETAEYRLFHTSNGGETWHLQLSDSGTERIHNIDFSDRQNGSLFMYNYKNKPWPGACLMTTSDGGETWDSEYLFKNMEYAFIDEVHRPSSEVTWLMVENKYLFTNSKFVDVNENNHCDDISILPNYLSAGREFIIRTSANELSEYMIYLYDITGNLVFEYGNRVISQATECLIRVPEKIVPGSYILLIGNDNRIVGERLIIK